jgi:hypothetical protein
VKRALLLTLAVSCVAATTQTWEMNGYQDFARGRMAGLSLTRDGKLIPGPAVNTIFDSGQPEIWSVAQAPDGSFYVGTGNRGRVFHVKQSGESALVWTADQPEIFTVVVDAKGVVYAASSPDGKVVRIENGTVSDFFAPGARYIWALAVAPDGALMVATGDEGKIFRVTAAGQASVYYETGQAHVTSLAFDSQGRLLAGSEPNGILYRITAAGKAFVLYNAKFPEIRAIMPAPDGSIYAAALGGGVARRVSAASAGSTAAPGANIPTISTTITVTDQQSGVTPAPKPEPPKLSAPAAQTTVVAPSSVSDISGGDRSALFRIWPDNTVETLWTSRDENVYDLALQGSSVVFLTDAQGRIYQLESNGKTTLMAQAGEGDATRLLTSPRGLVAATGNLGKLLRLDAGASPSGWFESPVHDSGTVARWGRLSWRGDAKGVTLRTRSGNSARPDATWSDWSAPLDSGAAIPSPNARFIQWRAEFTATPGGIDDVTVPYLPQNTPPVIHGISVAGAQAPAAPKPAPAASTTSAYSVTVTDTADSSSGTTSQSISRGAGQQIQISWLAEDPDGDRLIYNLYFRGEEESEWKLLHGNTTDNYYALESDVVADGRYYFRVTASDRLSNPAELARETEMVSAPVIVDNTPPVVTVSAPFRRTALAVEMMVDAVDRGSLLRRCEYSVDAGPWFPVEAADGVTDSAQEQFPIRIENLSPGEHLISIRVYDGVGNAGLAKVVVR